MGFNNIRDTFLGSSGGSSEPKENVNTEAILTGVGSDVKSSDKKYGSEEYVEYNNKDVDGDIELSSHQQAFVRQRFANDPITLHSIVDLFKKMVFSNTEAFVKKVFPSK